MQTTSQILGNEYSDSPVRRLAAFMWCFVIVLLDGYDLAIMGVALPSIMRQLQVSPGTAGLMASSALIGMAVGATALGSLAERIGRRKVFAICVLLFSAFTMAAGWSNDPVTFAVLRFIAGIGIGGALPNAVAHISEYSSAERRGTAVMLMVCGYTVGSVIAALLGKHSVDVHGWRIVFFAAGIPLVLIPAILTLLPESHVYTARRQRVTETGRSSASGAGHPDEQTTSAAPLTTSAIESSSLFRDGAARDTILIWFLFITGLFLVYSTNTWLVTLITYSGRSLGSALTFMLVYNGGAILGSILGGLIGDRTSLKWMLCAYYVIGVASFSILAITPSTTLLYITIAFVGASTIGTQNLCYAFCSQFYPASVRSTGIGLAAGAGRIGAIIAPVVIGALVQMHFSPAACFLAIATASVLGALCTVSIRNNSSDTHNGIIKSRVEHCSLTFEERRH